LSSNGNNGKNGNGYSYSNNLNIKWRRNKVIELSSQGFTQSDIATVLHVTQPTVNKDLAHLRQQAQENLQKHIHQTIPEEYQKGMVGLRQNLKHVLEIAETSSDPRIKLEARRIANDCYRYIMDLTTNGIIVTDAIKYVQGKMDHLNTAEKKLYQDIRDKREGEGEEDTKDIEDTGEGEQQTHNGIF
jgi:predicted transcriptional regulator